ncbi:MAG: adenosine kinase [Opitutae bacterium]|nr:adenosine kinase [Opitutae bacterium]
MSSAFSLIGIGSPIMDLLARVPEEFLGTIAGAKGGMVLVDPPEMAQLVARLATPPVQAPGGSAANTTAAVAQLGLATTFLGKLGDDTTAAQYRAQCLAAGMDGSRFKTGALPNARCLSLITPDSQRTMRTCLAAAMTLRPDEVSVADFRSCRHAHMEGYLLFNPALATAVVDAARAAGCTLSVDLASFEVVHAARPWLLEQFKRGLHVVFANEDEIRALFPGSDDYAALARQLAAQGVTACVKMGKDGAWIARGAELHRIAPVAVNDVVDTTGAGDAWAAGFLYGYLQGWTLPACGALGSHLGAETVRHIGPAIPATHWPRLREVASQLAAR